MQSLRMSDLRFSTLALVGSQYCKNAKRLTLRGAPSYSESQTRRTPVQRTFTYDCPTTASRECGHQPFLSTSSSRSKWLLNLIRVCYYQIIAPATALLKTGAEHYQAAQEAS
ncbi:uncharacterized protein LOC144299794 [Canis aureus]